MHCSIFVLSSFRVSFRFIFVFIFVFFFFNFIYCYFRFVFVFSFIYIYIYYIHLHTTRTSNKNRFVTVNIPKYLFASISAPHRCRRSLRRHWRSWRCWSMTANSSQAKTVSDPDAKQSVVCDCDGQTDGHDHNLSSQSLYIHMFARVNLSCVYEHMHTSNHPKSVKSFFDISLLACAGQAKCTTSQKWATHDTTLQTSWWRVTCWCVLSTKSLL